MLAERIPAKFEVVETLPESIRDQGGFGSTDIPKSPTLVSEITHGKSLSELYNKAGGISIKKKYGDEIKERQAQ